MTRMSASEAVRIRRAYSRYINYDEELFHFMKITNNYIDKLCTKTSDIVIDDENLDTYLAEDENRIDDYQDLKSCIYYGLYLSIYSYVEMRFGKSSPNENLYIFLSKDNYSNTKQLISKGIINDKYKNREIDFCQQFSFYNDIRNVLVHSNGYYNKEHFKEKELQQLQEEFKEKNQKKTKKLEETINRHQQIPAQIEKYDGIYLNKFTNQIHIDNAFIKNFWSMFAH